MQFTGQISEIFRVVKVNELWVCRVIFHFLHIWPQTCLSQTLRNRLTLSSVWCFCARQIEQVSRIATKIFSPKLRVIRIDWSKSARVSLFVLDVIAVVSCKLSTSEQLCCGNWPNSQSAYMSRAHDSKCKQILKTREKISCWWKICKTH